MSSLPLSRSGLFWAVWAGFRGGLAVGSGAAGAACPVWAALAVGSAHLRATAGRCGLAGLSGLGSPTGGHSGPVAAVSGQHWRSALPPPAPLVRQGSARRSACPARKRTVLRFARCGAEGLLPPASVPIARHGAALRLCWPGGGVADRDKKKAPPFLGEGLGATETRLVTPFGGRVCFVPAGQRFGGFPRRSRRVRGGSSGMMSTSIS